MRKNIFLFFILNAVSAQETDIKVDSSLNTSSAKNTDLKVNASFSGKSIENQQVELRSFGMAGNIKFKRPLAPMIDAQVDIGLILEAGSHKALQSQEYKPNQKVYMSEGSLRLTPFDQVQIKAGAINQKEYESPLLLTDTAFIGFQEKIFHNFGDVEIYFKAEQMIPNNETLTNRLGSVDEGTPTFYMETAGLLLKTQKIKFHFHLSRFGYSRLSNGVADQSRYMGNSIGGLIGPGNARFIYNYQGFNLFSQFSVNFYGESHAYIKGQYLHNQEAPNGRNNGILGVLGLKIEKRFEIWGDVFENQDDTAPAFYNDKFYGHNNRRGYGVGMKIIWPELKSYWETRFIQSNIIDYGPYQSNSQNIALNFVQELDI